MNYCMCCNEEADFVIQWGPNADQKEFVCADDMVKALEQIKAIEFFVVKIAKI